MEFKTEFHRLVAQGAIPNDPSVKKRGITIIQGLGWMHLAGAAIAGAAAVSGVTAALLWSAGWSLVTPGDAAAVRAIARVPGAANVLTQASAAEVAARFAFDEKVVHTLGETLKNDSAQFVLAAADYAAGFAPGERAYAISKLVSFAARPAHTVEAAEKLAQHLDERTLGAVAALDRDEQGFLAAYLSMSQEERNAARHVAAAMGANNPNVPRLGALFEAVIGGWDFRACAQPPLRPR